MYCTSLHVVHHVHSDYMHHDSLQHDPRKDRLGKGLELYLQRLHGQSSKKPKSIHAAADAQGDRLQGRQTAQETQKRHPKFDVVLVTALQKGSVAHASHHLARNFPEAYDLDVVEDLTRDNGEEILDSMEANVEEDSLERHELAFVADLVTGDGKGKQDGELLWHAAPVGDVASFEAHGVG
jgi:hypothetical protein